MAANWKRQRIGSLWKRVVTQICSSNSPYPTINILSQTTQRRAAQSSVYDKNPDDHIRPSIVPDHVISPQSDKYWSPHPQTGVFGPANQHNTTAAAPANGADQKSVLEQNAWFRTTSLEDLEKPHHP